MFWFDDPKAMLKHLFPCVLLPVLLRPGIALIMLITCGRLYAHYYAGISLNAELI